MVTYWVVNGEMTDGVAIGKVTDCVVLGRGLIGRLIGSYRWLACEQGGD